MIFRKSKAGQPSEPWDVGRLFKAGAKVVSEALLPGGSTLLSGRLAEGAAYTATGLIAAVVLGPPGVLLVCANSLSRSLTDKHLPDAVDDILHPADQVADGSDSAAVLAPIRGLLPAATGDSEDQSTPGFAFLQARTPLAKLLERAAPGSRPWLAPGALSLSSHLSSFLPPILFVTTVSAAQSGNSQILSSLGVSGVGTQFAILGLATVGVSALNLYLHRLRKKHWRELARQIEHRLRSDAFEHAQGLDMAVLDDRSSARTANIISSDTAQIGEFVELTVDEFIKKGLAVLVVGGVFLIAAPSLALIAALPLAGSALLARLYQKRLGTLHREASAQREDLSQLLADNLAGVATVKSFTAEELEAARMRESSARQTESSIAAADATAAFSMLAQGMFWIGYAATAAAGGYAVTQGKLSFTTYGFLLFGMPEVVGAAGTFEATMGAYHRAGSAAERLLEFFETRPAIRDGALPAPAVVRGAIEFRHVSFGYRGDHEVLHDTNLTVNAGETVAVVGTTGSGKSTLVKLLLRFYDPGQGSILVDGIDIRDWKLRDLRRTIGYVSQEPYLFNGTIRDNILFGRPGASQDDIIWAARLADAHDFISELPDGYDTVVGERGGKLSGGQRQRVAIARALLKQPAILILDEATASVDNETEAAIQQSLERLRGQCTVLVIAHRLTTVRRADRIYVFEQGQVREQGAHEQLIASNGIYSALWKMQA